MKTFKILSITLLSLMLLQTGNAAVMVPVQESVPTYSTQKSNGNLVKAVLHNGDYIPVVDLPCVEIVSTKPGNHMFSSTFTNGVYIAEVNLPAIEISALRNNAKKLPAYIHQGETIAISELPVIEIESELPYNHLLAASGQEEANIPVVNLPEIVIFPKSSDNFIVAATVTDGVLIPSVNLQVIEISPEFNWFITASNNEFTFQNMEIEWIYISLKNCGINLGNEIVCEVASKIKNNAGITGILRSGN